MGIYIIFFIVQYSEIVLWINLTVIRYADQQFYNTIVIYTELEMGET